jgi:hypothetical protein
MRETFAHEAVLVMDPDGDLRAPGGAVTLELCGAFEHEPPCPVAEHHTEAERVGGEVLVRTVFAATPEDEGAIRSRIATALAGGRLVGPDGRETRWEVRG